MSPALNASALLDAWDVASGRAVPERALRLLAAAHPGTSIGDIARWSIRRRDAALFDLRRRLFGRSAEGLVSCTACGDTLEISLELDRLQPFPAGDDESPRAVQIDDLTLTYRAPNSEDLLASARERDEPRARRALLACCVSDLTRDGSSIDIDALEADRVDAIVRTLAAALDDLTPVLSLECPSCGTATEVPFAIETFIWREIEAWAVRTLHEVDVLARRYGWSEAEILAMTARRRQRYLELAARA